MAQVDAVNTPSTPEAVGGELVNAYKNVVGRDPPNRSSWVIPLAQAAVETAAFGGGLWNNNIGNITTANPNSEDWMLLPGNTLKFRSFSNLSDGATAMMSWLNSHGCIPFADSGDIAGYVGALQKACYVGCDASVYPGYQTGIQNYVGKYGGIQPTHFFNLTWQTWAVVAGILLGGGCVAYYIAELPPGRRFAALKGL